MVEIAVVPQGVATTASISHVPPVEPRHHLNKGDPSIIQGIVYIKCFLNPCTGAPINDQVIMLPNLSEYLCSTGLFANLECFDAAQVLMSNKMTNNLCDWYLDTRMVNAENSSIIIVLT
jgi:hypothetical protein